MTRSRHSRSKKLITSHSAKGKRFKYYRTSHPKKPSKGWKSSFPHRGRERNLIYKTCGAKAFLMPKELKFPVVKSYRKRSGRSNCKTSCKGLLSAYRRARQYKYRKVASKALSRAKRSRCSWLR